MLWVVLSSSLGNFCHLWIRRSLQHLDEHSCCSCGHLLLATCWATRCSNSPVPFISFSVFLMATQYWWFYRSSYFNQQTMFAPPIPLVRLDWCEQDHRLNLHRVLSYFCLRMPYSLSWLPTYYWPLCTPFLPILILPFKVSWGPKGYPRFWQIHWPCWWISTM